MPNTEFFIGHCVLLSGLVFLLWAVATLSDRSRSVTLTAGIAMAGVGLTVLGGGVIAGTGGIDTTVPDESQLKWIEIDLPKSGAQLKVLALYAPVEEDLRTEWDRVAVLLATSNLAFDSLQQDTAPDYGDEVAGRIYRLDLNPAAPDIAAQSLEFALYDLSSCTFGGKVGEGDWSIEGNMIFGAWLEGKGAFGSNAFVTDPAVLGALERMTQMNTAESQTWIADHTENISTCAWDKSDFN